MEPIAIIGMACRWPGANSPAQLEQMLRSGSSGKGPVPSEYYNINGFFHPNKDRPGSLPMREGYFLDEDPRKFDYSFFGINPAEARSMDPQQRQLLEVCYECLESAGTTMEQLSETVTGCFVGNFTFEHSLQRFRDPDFNTTIPYNSTGHFLTLLGNRISHVLNLRGPSITIDTACSSSMYALHLACNSLQAGDCKAALVAGVNLMFGPDLTMDCAKLGVLSPTAACHTFDIAADGYARAEGVGALYIKKLQDAIIDGDPIRAVVCGTAVNSNGRTPGVTHPNATAQAEVIQQAYRRANISEFDKTSYFECHGTGTPTGDPIEVEAIGRVFASSRPADKPLLIGSIKTNIGHSEAASGMASIMKAVLSLEHATVYPTIGLQVINPKINLIGNRVRIATKCMALPQTGASRISVNCFGFGGANAHVILECPQFYLSRNFIPLLCNVSPNLKHRRNSAVYCTVPRNEQLHAASERVYLLFFSSKTRLGLERNISAIAKAAFRHLPRDIAFTLSARRSKFARRAYTLLQGRSYEIAFENMIYDKNRPPSCIGFIFTGQGAQWPQMGVQLMNEFPTFRESIRRLDSELKTLRRSPGWRIEELLRESENTSTVHKAEHAQPLCTALQVALVDLLASWNVIPTVTVGHSSGEIAAAYACGALTSSEAIMLAYFRGIAVTKVTTTGAMLAVGLGSADFRKYQERFPQIQIACINSGQSLTLSGGIHDIETLHQELIQEKVFSRTLKTDGKAYHSDHMVSAGEYYEAIIEEELALCSYRDKRGVQRARMISSVRADEITDSSELTPAYWRRNLETTVRFQEAVAILPSYGVNRFVEVGPHSALEGPLRHIRHAMGDTAPSYSPTIVRGKDSTRSLLELVGTLLLESCPVDLQAVNSDCAKDNEEKYTGRTITDLPSYHWDHSNIQWAESRLSYEYKHRPHPHHDLLGSRLPYGGSSEGWWRNILKPKDIPWLADHQIQNETVFPAAGYLAMAVEAMTQHQEIFKLAEEGNEHLLRYMVRDVKFSAPLTLDAAGCESLLRLNKIDALSERTYEFKISSTSADQGVWDKRRWTQHCSGNITLEFSAVDKQSEGHHVGSNRHRIERLKFYEKSDECGLNYGDTFQNLHNISVDRRTGFVLAEASRFPTATVMPNESRYPIHPATLDAAFQAGAISASNGYLASIRGQLPVFIEKLTMDVSRKTKGQELLQLLAHSRKSGPRSAVGEFSFISKGLNVTCTGYRTTGFADSEKSDSVAEKVPYLKLVWKPDITSVQCISLSSRQTEENFLVGLTELTVIVDLCLHKDPGVNILQIDGLDTIDSIKSIIYTKRRTKRFQRYVVASQMDPGFTAELPGVFHLTDLNQLDEKEKFGLVLYEQNKSERTGCPLSHLDRLSDHLLPSSLVIARKKHLEGWQLGLENFEKTGFHTDHYVLLKRKFSGPASPTWQRPELIIVHRDTSSPSKLHSYVTKEANKRGWMIKNISLETLDVPTGSKMIVLADLEKGPILATLTSPELKGMQKMVATEKASVVWVTAGDLMTRADPASALISGLARTLSLEEPGLNFQTFDIESAEDNQGRTARVLCEHVQNALFSQIPQADGMPGANEREYAEKNGVTHICRFVPDDSENRIYELLNSGGNGSKYKEMTVTRPLERQYVKMHIGEVGRPESLFFYDDTEINNRLADNYIEVEVKVASVNQRDTLHLLGIAEQKISNNRQQHHYSFERAGIVTRVGSAVSDIVPGDRVVSVGPGHYGTIEQLPAYAFQKLSPFMSFKDAVSIFSAYATVVYGLITISQLAEGEALLVYEGYTDVGIAALSLGKAVGAKCYTSVRTEAQKQYVKSTFNFSDEVIFVSDGKTLKGFKGTEIGQTFDVIMTWYDTGILQDAASRMAYYGKLVDITIRKPGENSILLSSNFIDRNASLITLDLESLYWHKPTLYASMLKHVSKLCDAEIVKPLGPIEEYDVTDLSNVLRRYIQTTSGITGKVVVDYGNTKSKIRWCSLSPNPKDHQVSFRQNGTYLLIGGLGGLGRSLLSWMVERGAMSFVTMSRSGCESDNAVQAIKGVQASGARIIVLKGDVSKRADVERAIQAAPSTIRGVIHAAMVLKDGLFRNASTEDFHAVIQPKYMGALHLHELLPDTDFFLLMSSISAALGTISQGAYAAANASLDALARCRRQLGMPASSVALGSVSEVGYVSEHPDIQEKLNKNGIYPISEDEYLLAIEAGIRRQLFYQRNSGENHSTSSATHREDDLTYLLTGLDPSRLKSMIDRGFDGGSYIHLDKRFAVIRNSLLSERGETKNSSRGPEKLHSLLKRTYQGDGKETASAIFKKHFMEKLSSLLLIPVVEFDEKKSLPENGLDSMIGSELRIWLHRALDCTVSFMELSAEGQTLGGLIGSLFQRLQLSC